MPNEYLSQRLQKLKASPTVAINAKANELKANGVDIVNMVVGEPDFDTPDYIKDAGIAAIKDGFTRYTPANGMKELREAVCEKFKRDNSLNYTSEQISITPGGKFGYYALMQSIIDPGDKVIVSAPYWVSYPPIVELAGGEAIIIQTKSENHFKLTPKDLENIDMKGVKAIVMNSPSNPTGVIYSKEELEVLLTPLAEKGILIVSDEIYEDIVYDDSFVSVPSISEALYRQTILLHGVSKSFSMTGWRIGFAAGNIDIIKAINKIQTQSISNATSISQKATVTALKGGRYIKGGVLESMKQRRDFVCNALEEMKEFTIVKPGGAFYVFPEVSERLIDASVRVMEGVHRDLAFVSYLLEKHHIAFVPGEGFGAEKCFRISYAVDPEALKEGMKRLSLAVQELLSP